MTLRRGFNRLFIAMVVCWNLGNLWVVFKKARESVASANMAAEEVLQVRQSCISAQESCTSARRARDAAAAKRRAAREGISNEGGDDPKLGHENQLSLDTPEQPDQAGKRGKIISLDEIDPPECDWFSDINCDAVYAVGSKPSIWRECKSQLADTKTILYIEGIPVGVYITCWVIAATFLWIARGFGLAGRKEKD